MLIPGALRDNPKAKSRSELLALRRNPDTYGQVIEERQALADTLRDTEARDLLDTQLRTRGQVQLIAPDLTGEQRKPRYVVNADRLIDNTFATRDGRRIEVVRSDGDIPTRRFVTDSASLVPSPSATAGTPTFDLVLGRHEVSDLSVGGAVNQREHLTIPGLTVAGVSDDDLMQLSSDDLIARARNVRGNPERIRQRIIRLQNEIKSLGREISSRLLNRYALSVTAPLLLMLGSILAMWLRGSLPLTIYILAFLPAVIDLILISAGEQLMRDGRALGPIIMWSGNALMLGIIGFAYLRLARH
jgi:hypothetical protein